LIGGGEIPKQQIHRQQYIYGFPATGKYKNNQSIRTACMFEVIGRTTINPFLFYTGKIAGYLTWLFGLYHSIFIRTNGPMLFDIIAGVFFAFGASFTLISMLNLGASVRLGLPTGNTAFKKSGLYSFSRNPMYVGFDLFTLSGILLLRSWQFVLLGLFSMLVYHLIIIGEERFLEERFGQEYREYKQKVRRYI
jgi:protein-S-isoprenylcysteine O-methyltransferase Ste14